MRFRAQHTIMQEKTEEETRQALIKRKKGWKSTVTHWALLSHDHVERLYTGLEGLTRFASHARVFV